MTVFTEGTETLIRELEADNRKLTSALKQTNLDNAEKEGRMSGRMKKLEAVLGNLLTIAISALPKRCRCGGVGYHGSLCEVGKALQEAKDVLKG